MSSGFRATNFLAFLIGFFVRPESLFLRPDPQLCKAGARRSSQGWPSHQPFHALWLARPYLDSSEHGGPPDGSPRSGARINRATILYSVGPRTQTMMQSCASAAKLRGGEPILFLGTKAMTQAGTPPPRTVIGDMFPAGRRATIRPPPSSTSAKASPAVEEAHSRPERARSCQGMAWQAQSAWKG